MDIIGLGTTAMDALIQVDSLPKEDGFALIQNKTYIPGGSGTNVIVQAARLGAQTGFIAKVGNDAIGLDTVQSLKTENVDVSAIRVKEKGTSLNTQVIVDSRGAKFILLEMGDCFLNLEPEEIDFDLIKKAKVFYTDLIPGPPAISALKYAKKHGLRTAFNMQVDLKSMNNFSITKEMILDSLQYVDLFAPCREGLFQLCETENLHECLTYIRPYFKHTLLITLGSEGSIAFNKENKKFFQPIEKVNVIDTTGAGDSYMGAMVFFYLLKGEPLKHSLRLATACAAITCSQLGARTGPKKDDLEDFLSSL
ncbi:MAG: carbohydrate kinase family protein [Sphaerochaetaceae bacterium]